MDTIAIVGSGEAALALLVRALTAGLEVVAVSPRPDAQRIQLHKRARSHRRAADALVRFTDDLESVAECSFVIDCTEVADASARAQALRALENRMTEGAILASAAEDLTGLSSLLARPAQFLGMRPVDGLARLRITTTAQTGLGVADMALRLGRMLSPEGLDSGDDTSPDETSGEPGSSTTPSVSASA